MKNIDLNSPKWKGLHEMAYWKIQKNKEGTFSNKHYEFLFTKHFGFCKADFDKKVLLDIGCGPRGSLEWATNAKRRIGLDPLASKYVNELGADLHEMEYMSVGSENIPLEDGACDVIFSLNSLDHVDNLNSTICEIKRCLSSNGIFLLIVEVNHEVRTCEPQSISPSNIIKKFLPEFQASYIKLFKPHHQGIYKAVEVGEIFEDSFSNTDVGYFSARFERIKS